MNSRNLLPGLILACALAAPARALPFSAGDLIVTSDTEIIELAALSGEIIDRLAIAGAAQPCFLPNGNLLVVGGFGLLEIEPGGGVVREIDVDISDAVLLGVLAGPNGDVYVRIETALVRIDLDTGNVESSIDLRAAVQPSFLPNGNLLVPTNFVPTNSMAGGSGLLEVHPTSGEILRGVLIDGISEITGAAPGPDGTLILTTVDEIVVVDPISGAIIDRLAIAGVIQPCFLPNGNLLVIDAASGALQEIDLAGGEVVATPFAGGASGVTMVPYRFRMVVRGTLARPDGLANLSEIGTLALGPGMRRMTLALAENDRLATVFATDVLVLDGFEAPSSGNQRLFQGSQVPASDRGGALASLVLRVVGNGGIASARGSLHLAAGGGIFDGTVSTSTLLNR